MEFLMPFSALQNHMVPAQLYVEQGEEHNKTPNCHTKPLEIESKSTPDKVIVELAIGPIIAVVLMLLRKTNPHIRRTHWSISVCHLNPAPAGILNL